MTDKYFVWQLAPDSDPEERFIIVTDDGDTEVTGIINEREDAEAFAACLNAMDRLGRVKFQPEPETARPVVLCRKAKRIRPD